MAKRYTIIRDQIIAKLNTALSGVAAQITNYPTLQFDKYPAAYIVPEDGESGWLTNTLDSRSYAFVVNLYYETKQTGKSAALDALMNLVDDILDEFAEDKQLSTPSPGLQSQLSTAGYTNDVVESVQPVSAQWGEVPERELLVASIKINAILAVPNQ